MVLYNCISLLVFQETDLFDSVQLYLEDGLECLYDTLKPKGCKTLQICRELYLGDGFEMVGHSVDSALLLLRSPGTQIT